MTRRALLFATVAAALRADSEYQVRSLFVSLASALSGGRASEFMDAFDPAMPGYQTLRAVIAALLRDFEVQSVIDLLSNAGDDRARSVEADWALRITERSGAAASIQRRQKVTCRAEKPARKWRIVSFEPLSLFDPPRF